MVAAKLCEMSATSVLVLNEFRALEGFQPTSCNTASIWMIYPQVRLLTPPHLCDLQRLWMTVGLLHARRCSECVRKLAAALSGQVSVDMGQRGGRIAIHFIVINKPMK